MQVAWFQRGAVVSAAVLALMVVAPREAAPQDGGVSPAAGDLDKRTKSGESSEDQSKGLSDSAVRVLMTYAFSFLPEKAPGPDGKPYKVDKSDPNKFLIPTDDARRVIRVATRSAYAEVCKLPDLQRANYQTFMRGEEAKKTWSQDQLLMIDALHMFSTSYFAGTLKLTATEAPADATGQAVGATAVSKSDAPPQAPAEGAAQSRIIAPEPPKCPPEQKQKVTDAINAYVQSAQATSPAPKAAE